MKLLPVVLIRDAAILAGAGCIIGGCWWVYTPIGVILLGACLATFGILWELDAHRKRAEEERNRRAGL